MMDLMIGKNLRKKKTGIPILMSLIFQNQKGKKAAAERKLKTMIWELMMNSKTCSMIKMTLMMRKMITKPAQ
jgi:hypothetical protein